MSIEDLRSILEEFAYSALKEKPSDIVAFGLDFFQKIKEKKSTEKPIRHSITASEKEEDDDVAEEITEMKKSNKEEPIYENFQVETQKNIKRESSLDRDKNHNEFHEAIEVLEDEKLEEIQKPKDEKPEEIQKPKNEKPEEIQKPKDEKPEEIPKPEEVEKPIEKKANSFNTSIFNRFIKEVSHDKPKQESNKLNDNLTEEPPKNLSRQNSLTIEQSKPVSTPESYVLRTEKTEERSEGPFPSSIASIKKENTLNSSVVISKSEDSSARQPSENSETTSLIRRESLKSYLPSRAPEVTREASEADTNKNESIITRTSNVFRRESLNKPQNISPTRERSESLEPASKRFVTPSVMTRSFISSSPTSYETPQMQKEEQSKEKIITATRPSSNAEATNNFFSKLITKKFGSSQQVNPNQ